MEEYRVLINIYGFVILGKRLSVCFLIYKGRGYYLFYFFY